MAKFCRRVHQRWMSAFCCIFSPSLRYQWHSPPLGSCHQQSVMTYEHFRCTHCTLNVSFECNHSAEWLCLFCDLFKAPFAPVWTETILKRTILHYKHSVSYWNTKSECVCSGAVSTVSSSISAVTRSNEEHNSSLLRTHLFLFPPAFHCTESVAAALPPVWRHRLSVSL